MLIALTRSVCVFNEAVNLSCEIEWQREQLVAGRRTCGESGVHGGEGGTVCVYADCEGEPAFCHEEVQRFHRAGCACLDFDGDDVRPVLYHEVELSFGTAQFA